MMTRALAVVDEACNCHRLRSEPDPLAQAGDGGAAFVQSPVGAIAVIVALAAALALASDAFAADAAKIERGRYITHDVAMCVQCHTPRDESGTLIESKAFMGATFPVGPPGFIPEAEWCIATPRVAGLPGFTDDEAVEFFMTGARLGRHQPKWPMPPFRMNRADAEAVVAYLRSLDRPAGEPR
jgi:mono/diheme cytochrome c family protein